MNLHSYFAFPGIADLLIGDVGELLLSGAMLPELTVEQIGRDIACFHKDSVSASDGKWPDDHCSATSFPEQYFASPVKNCPD